MPMNMQILHNYAFSFIGRPYRWGGDDPLAGFDCSGFIQELLMSAGVIRRGTGKMNAQGLFLLLERNNAGTSPQAGAISFFGKDFKSIIHVGYCLDSEYMLHSGSGDSTTLNESVAIEQNAFVRMDRIKYRKDFLSCLRPQYPGSI